MSQKTLWKVYSITTSVLVLWQHQIPYYQIDICKWLTHNKAIQIQEKQLRKYYYLSIPKNENIIPMIQHTIENHFFKTCKLVRAVKLFVENSFRYWCLLIGQKIRSTLSQQSPHMLSPSGFYKILSISYKKWIILNDNWIRKITLILTFKKFYLGYTLS